MADIDNLMLPPLPLKTTPHRSRKSMHRGDTSILFRSFIYLATLLRCWCFENRFGILRLWGAVGFGVASLIGGYVCDAYGGSYVGVMAVFVGNVLVALLASTGVPIGQGKDRCEGSSRNR